MYKLGTMLGQLWQEVIIVPDLKANGLNFYFLYSNHPLVLLAKEAHIYLDAKSA